MFVCVCVCVLLEGGVVVDLLVSQSDGHLVARALSVLVQHRINHWINVLIHILRQAAFHTL